MADTIDGARLQPQPQPQPAPRTGVQEGFCVNRGALVSLGFLAGWLPVSCCSLGLVPALLSGLGVGTAYFAMGNTLLFGLGWTPIWGLVSIAIELLASYFMVRPAFARYSRDVAMRSF